MFLFHDPSIDLWVDTSLMIMGERGCRVGKGKIYALITLEECAKVPKNVGQISGVSSSRSDSYFCKTSWGKRKGDLVPTTMIFPKKEIKSVGPIKYPLLRSQRYLSTGTSCFIGKVVSLHRYI